MAVKSKFKYGNQEVEMQLGYGLAYGKLFDLGLDILSVMKNGEVISTIMMDDSTMLKVWFYYLTEAGVIEPDNFSEALDVLDEMPQGLAPFKKAFWDMVVGFSPTQAQPALREMWKAAEKQLKNAGEKISTISTSPSPPDSDSI